MTNSPEVSEGCGCLLMAVAIMVIGATIIMVGNRQDLVQAIIGLIGRLP